MQSKSPLLFSRKIFFLQRDTAPKAAIKVVTICELLDLSDQEIMSMAADMENALLLVVVEVLRPFVLEECKMVGSHPVPRKVRLLIIYISAPD